MDDQPCPHTTQSQYAVFRSGDRALYRAAQGDLNRGIKKAKTDHKRSIESHLSSNNTWEVWRGVQDFIIHRGSENRKLECSQRR